MPIPCLTAGQRTAVRDLRDAFAARKPLVLLFGDSGSGRSSVIHDLLGNADPQEIVAVGLTATDGDVISPPTFEMLLEAACQRLSVQASSEQRPASLAGLATAVAAVAEAGKTLVMSIDHADQLSDEVIVEVARLHEYLDVPPAAVIRVFVGSLALASRIDTILRRIGAEQRLAEIRLSQPTAEEVATILAYEDNARPGGPTLSPEAIARISAYARSNLHWAVPMADAARALAEIEGAREVTPDMVREALLDIWSPEHQAVDDSTMSPERFDLGAGVFGAARVESFPGLADGIDRPVILAEPASRADVSGQASDALHEATSPIAGSRLHQALKAGAAMAALLVGLGAAAFYLGRHDANVDFGRRNADVDRQTVGSAAVGSQSGGSGSVPEPLRPLPQSMSADVTSPASGAAGTDLEAQVRRVEERRGDPVSTESAGGVSDRERQGGADADDAEAAPAASAPAASSTGSSIPSDEAALKPGALSEKPPVAPTPKRPEEKTAQPWVQVR